MIRQFGNGKSLQVMQGDITQVPVDAIANAANSDLAGGGGVDGAIHAAGGPAIMKELSEIRAAQRTCPPGSAVATSAGHLPAKWVFHAVGPRYHGGNNGEEATLRSAYRACLDLAEEKGVDYISLPSISTGIYGYPVDLAAPVALGEVATHLRSPDSKLQRAVFVLYDEKTLKAYEKALDAIPE